MRLTEAYINGSGGTAIGMDILYASSILVIDRCVTDFKAALSSSERNSE